MGPIYGVKFWLHKMADHVLSHLKRKIVQFRGMFVWLIIFYFLKLPNYPLAFHNKRFQTLYRNQLWSKITCSFKPVFIYLWSKMSRLSNQGLVLYIRAFYNLYLRSWTLVVIVKDQSPQLVYPNKCIKWQTCENFNSIGRWNCEKIMKKKNLIPQVCAIRCRPLANYSNIRLMANRFSYP